MDRITLKNVCKQIKGIPILEHIDLELEEGGIYGFMGINGSGKTMLFRAIAGLIRTEGEITVFGKRIGEDVSFPPELGIVIESVGFWRDYTGLQNLRLLASIRKAAKEEDIRNALERVGLQPDDPRKYKKYSLGMKQRLAIAQAVMERPRLLILDEPTNALDEDGIQRIRAMIQEEKDRGATVLIASHQIDELKQICDRCFKISEGRLKEEGENA